jgi:RNA polymerase sigma-70 factor (ECF subfamily)
VHSTPPPELAIPTLGDDAELEALVARAREGSRTAFAALAARVRARVHGWATTLTRDSDDAEDVAQLVLLRLHRQVVEFEGRSRITTWLYTVTKRVVLSRRARAGRREALLGIRADELRAHDAAAESNAASVDGEARAVRAAMIVASCLGVLSGREREVFELGDLRGLNASEIAARLGTKAVTVRTQLMRARRRIRLRMLEEHPELLEDYCE